MFTGPPLTAEARKLAKRILPGIRSRIQEVNRVPVSILLWGPGVGSSSPIARLRIDMRSKLRGQGHACFFSEEIIDPKLSVSIRAQELAQAQEFDLVVSIPCTPGSIAEVHDFASDRRVTGKMLVFLNMEHLTGYSAKSLQALSTILSAKIEYYPNERELSLIEEMTFEHVQRIRELKYIIEGRHYV
jgi:hypothetical protein